jgi:hypothetical protein
MSNDPNKCNEPHCERTRVWHPLGCLSTKCREHTIKFHQQRMGWAAKGVVHSECIDMLRAGATQWPRYEGRHGDEAFVQWGHLHPELPVLASNGSFHLRYTLDVLTDAMRALCSTHPETPCAGQPGVASAAGGGALTGAVEQDTPREPFGEPDPYTGRPQCSRNHAAGKLAGLVGDLVGSLSMLRRLRPEPLSARVMRGEVADPYRFIRQPTAGARWPRSRSLAGKWHALERAFTETLQPHAIAAQAALAEEYRPKTCEVLADVQDWDE